MSKTETHTSSASTTQRTEFHNLNAIIQAPPLALTRGLHELELDNPFLKVKDPVIVSSGASDMNEDWLSRSGDEHQTLDDYLLEQINLEFRDVPLRKVLIDLVSYLDEDGYLRTPLEELEAKMDCSHEMATDALAILQTLSPTGVGARDLRECLLLQADAAEHTPALVHQIISRGLKLVADNDLKGLCSQFDASPEDVVDAIAHIKRLSPAPGSYYSQQRTRVAVPELVVELVDGTPTVSPKKGSRVHISFDEEYYADMLKHRDGSLRRFLAQQRADYEWLDYSLKKRYETLLTLGEFIVQRQQSYFTDGMKLRPLLVRDAVAATHLTAGIVNRMINGHYLEWRGQPVELRRFFSYRKQN
ncbi:RNA polymerase factor sigma-54 [Lacticaseibacillus zhaodongensis]|uniref:RNA polymerase factor sigma-54 n=1 Tax=Lacticaseibacillus zhaodongensis TaxID=2668065 RepID=UPI0012D311F8|nr:hypothetical protein [Lacticaseibacillus zhaodongensis]